MLPIEALLNIYWWPALCPSETSPQHFSYEWHSTLAFSFYTLTNQQVHLFMFIWDLPEALGNSPRDRLVSSTGSGTQ